MVVTITAMVSLIIFPRLQQGLSNLVQRQSASLVAAQLRQARGAAIARDGPVTFQIARDGRSDVTSTGQRAPTPVGVSLFFRDGADRIVFYGDGTATGGIVGVRSGAHVLSVSVAPVDGSVALAR